MLNIRKFSWTPIGVALITATVLACFNVVGVFTYWSARMGDRLFISRNATSDIAIVSIDDASIAQLGRWPWSRSVHAQLINKLTEAGVRVIGYDVNFPEASTETDDKALEDAIRTANNVVLPIELEIQQKGRKELVFTPEKTLSPISRLAAVAKSTGHTNTPPDADGVMRRIPLFVDSPENGGSSIPAFTVEVARLAGLASHTSAAPVDTLDRMTVNYLGAPGKNFPTFRAIDVIRGTVSTTSLKGRIVFVGSTAANLHDELLAPTSEGVPMAGVEIHASAFETIASQKWVKPVPKVLSTLFLLGIGLVIGLAITMLRLRINLPLVFLLWIGFLIGSFLLFERGIQVDLLWPTITFVFVYAAVTLERRVHADRERRQLRTAFSRYVSSSVVDSIMQNPDKLRLGGERRRMSVLFSDIRGFTTISEGMTPDVLVNILNIYLNRMTDIVFKHAGVLDKYIGDAVMAFWNAPLDQSDHALRAVSTGLEMRDALEELNASKAFGDLEMHIGIGINTGEMVVGNVGGNTRFDYTVIGDNVNLGSRLEGLTKEYGVAFIIAESTKGELRDAVITRRLDKVTVKGKKEPVVIYEAMELKENATQQRIDLAHDFESALDLYFSRQFEQCIESCQVILKKYPNDGPTNNLLERAKIFLNAPPAMNWDGTWVFTKK
ncbi:adenylate/guanylate cyclase domain-containing protein [Candidatus Uhrbacteria bacterium]|nr:adenylate/guanylate cyclase domain-containing protein [Candidatus Uhrbacteria bacterium]